MISAADLVKDSQLPVRFSEEYTHHNRHGREERWKQQRLLGKGGFGSVWLQQCWPANGHCRLRAVKVIPKSSLIPESIDYTHELLAIAKFSQPKYEDFFVRSFGWYEDDEHVFITMEYFEHGDLGKYLRHPFPEREAQLITGQLLRGLDYMHSSGFTHRDLKPKNIFVVSKGPSWWVKIGDFGVSKEAEGSIVLQTVVGTPSYLAPEILEIIIASGDEANFSYTSAVDMWSLGVIVCQLLSGQAPSRDNKNLIAFLKDPAKFPSEAIFSNGISQEAHELLKGLLAAKPDDRLSARNALQQDWLKKSQEESTEGSSQENLHDLSATDLPVTKDSSLPADGPAKGSSTGTSESLASAGFFEASARWSALDGTALGSTTSKYQQVGEAAEYDASLLRRRTSQAEVIFIPLEEEPEEDLEPDDSDSLRKVGPILDSGLSLYNQERFEEAQTKFQETVDIRERISGPDHRDTLDSLYWLGRAVYCQGKYQEAEMIFQRAVDGLEKILEQGHLATLYCVYWLGLSLHFQGRYQESEKKLLQAVEGLTKAVGAGHPDTLLSAYWLGHSLHFQGRYQEAVVRFQQAVTGQERCLGYSDENTLYSAFWLGLSLYLQGKYLEAEPRLQQAVDGQEKVLGFLHKVTLNSVFWLGLCFYQLGEYRLAEIRLQQAVDGQEKTLGHDHRGTLCSVFWLGCAQYSEKKYQAAHINFERAVDGQGKALGFDHKDTLNSVYWLGLTLFSQKRYQAALMRFQQAVDGQKKLLGHDHQDTLNSIHWLNRSSVERKRLKNTPRRFLQALKGYTKS
ncbi:hypothetical protein VTO42DRAFT_3480 [Malbranchea cinnamomea]